jgi:hypothetical protein
LSARILGDFTGNTGDRGALPGRDFGDVSIWLNWKGEKMAGFLPNESIQLLDGKRIG